YLVLPDDDEHIRSRPSRNSPREYNHGFLFMRHDARVPLIDRLVRNILTSRVYEVARETPLDHAPRLSARLGNTVLLKREDLQPVFSFKLRGAYNKIAQLSEEARARGVIAAS